MSLEEERNTSTKTKSEFCIDILSLPYYLVIVQMHIFVQKSEITDNVEQNWICFIKALLKYSQLGVYSENVPSQLSIDEENHLKGPAREAPFINVKVCC